MSYLSIELPEKLRYGSAFGVGFVTQIQSSGAGHEQRTLRSSVGRHRFRLDKAELNQAELIEMKSFVLATLGAFSSFKVKDWTDYTSAANGKDTPSDTDQAIGTGDGSEQQFQLAKDYPVTGVPSYLRQIRLPVAGTVVVALDGVPQASGWSVNTETGIVTFTTAPGIGVLVTAGFEFRCEVRFEQDADTLLNQVSRAFDVWDLDAFNLIEIVPDEEWPDRFFPGGGYDWGDITESISVSFRNGSLQRFAATATGVSAFLPAPGNTPGGVFLFTLENKATATQSATLRDDTGASLATIAAGTFAHVDLATDSSGNRYWVIRQ